VCSPAGVRRAAAAQTEGMGSDRILVGIIGTAPAEAALRYAFGEARQRGAAVRVVATGPASHGENVLVRDLVRRWAEKYPAVESTYQERRAVDPVITLAAASRHACLMVVEDGAEARTAAVLAALAHQTHCALVTVTGSPEAEAGSAGPVPGPKDPARRAVPVAT
jgi:hypothetical protein